MLRRQPRSTVFFNDTATTEIYTLSLHDALPIYLGILEPRLGYDIEGVALLHEPVEGRRGRGQALEVVGEAVVVDGENAADLYAVDEAALVTYLIQDGRLAHKTEPQGPFLAPYLGARDAFGALKINHFAELSQVIELASPVGTHRKDVDTVALDVVDFLSFVLLDDDFVGQSGSPHGLDTLHQRLLNVDFAPFPVESVGRDTHDQIVTQGLCPLEQTLVAAVKQVVSAISNDLYHNKNRC